MIKTFTTLFFLSFLIIGNAQNLHVDIKIGSAIGSPIGKLSEIPEGASGKPGFGLFAGFNGEYDLTDHLSISLGAFYTQKGSEFTSPTDGKYDIARALLGEGFPLPLNVNYDGTVQGSFKNQYLEFPVMVGWRWEKMKVSAGYAFSHLLKGNFSGEADIEAWIINLKDVGFDETPNLSKKDHTVLLGTEFFLNDRFGLGLNFSWAWTKILVEEMEDLTSPRNLYGMVYLRYRVF